MQGKTHVDIERVIFSYNHDRNIYPVIFQLVNSKKVTLKGCAFLNNHGSPIQSYFSQITFMGYNVFKQNRAFSGGALALLHSRIIITGNTQIDFIENRVEKVGGAIYIRGLPKPLSMEADSQKCFYQLPSVHNMGNLAALNSTLNFYNNTAGGGGENIYGAPLKSPCFVSDNRVTSSQSCKSKFYCVSLSFPT